MTRLSDEGGLIVALARMMFERLDEHSKVAPDEVDAIVVLLVGHLRSWRPESVSPLGSLPPPTERIRDPRKT